MSSSAHWTSSMDSAIDRIWRVRRPRRPPGRTPAGAWRPATGSRSRARHDRRWPRDSPDRSLGRGPRGRVADRDRREQAAREEERPADLLVGRDRDAREPARRREFDRGEQQPCLADARLALEGHRGQSAGRLAELLRDRLELGAPTDDGSGRPTELHGERTLGSDEGVERAAVGHPKGRAMLDRRNLAQHVSDYALLPSARSAELVGVPLHYRAT